MSKNRFIIAWVAVLNVSAFFTSTMAVAETPSTPAATTILEEIVVTARQREESLRDVPMSVSVLTDDMIEARNISVLDDMVNQTANLFMINDQDPGTNVITIRGITTNRNQPGSVAFVIDGVTQPDTDGFTREYFDLERIEVLKGPQGALYGKNAIGGVINIVTRHPTNDYESTIKMTAGNGELTKVQAFTSGPLVTDRLYYRLSASYKDLDGYIRNRYLDERADFSENKDLRGRLLWEPGENWSFDFRASYMDEDSGATWFSASDLLTQADGGKVSDDLLVSPRADLLGAHERTLTDVSVKVDYNTAWGTVTALTAYNDIEKFFAGDLDNTELELIQPASQKLDLNAYTQELRFTSPDDQALRHIVGLFYQKTDRDYTQAIDGFDLGFFGLVPGLPMGVPSGISVAFPPLGTSSEFEQWAVFAQINYDVSDKLELSAALRYDEETKEQYDVPSMRTDRATFDDWQPRFTASYKINERLMLYGVYSQGFKSGGFNPPPENFPITEVDFELVIRKEETEGVEIGFKSTLWEERLSFSVAAFQTQYQGLQLFQFDPFAQQVTINVEEVNIKGFDAELAIIATENLRFDFSYGYTDSEIDDFNGTGMFDGNTAPNTPDYTMNVGLQYTRDVGAGLSLQGRLDWRCVGDFYWQEDNVLYTPGYQFIDARISLRIDKWELAFWGKNTTHERWAVGGFSRTFSPLILGTLGADNYTINAGRQIGFDVRVDF